MTAVKNVKLHTNSTKTRFTHIFLRSLLKMRKVRVNRVVGSSSKEAISKRSQRIKIAAYSSMARAVGSRRAWSRALLFKLRNRARLQGIVRKRCLDSKKKNRVVKKKVSEEPKGVDTLRKLVPGGQAMDICSLLEETADFVKCLATQVKVMETIVDLYSK